MTQRGDVTVEMRLNGEMGLGEREERRKSKE